MAYVVEITGYDPVAAGVRTLVYAMGPGIAFTDSTFAPSALTSWNAPSQKVDVSKEGGITLTGDNGKFFLANMPAAIGGAGPLDSLADWSWFNRRANLYYIPASGLWADRFLVSTGLMTQPIVNLMADGSLQSSLDFDLRDPRAGLDVPLQPSKFAGTNAAGAGVEGEGDLKGKPKPVLYGVVSNIPGVRVNASRMIWLVADKAATILCVRDGGVPLTAGVSRANTASMEANVPTPGTYDYCSVATGTYVRLGSTPRSTLTFDVQEGATAADRTHAQIWKRLRTERCDNVSGDIDATSVTATDALDANEVGFWWDDETPRLRAVNEVLTSLSGYEVQGFDLRWSLARLIAPSGTAALDFAVLGPTSAATPTTRFLRTLQRVRPNFAPDGAPPYRVNVRWGRNYTVMSEGDFHGAAIQRLRDKFTQEWRTETATNTAIWNPTTLAGPWPNAPELTIETAYQPGADSVTCPHAATEASRLVALYSSLKGQYIAYWSPEPTDRILPGAVVSLTFGQMSLSGGPKFRVLQSLLAVENSVLRMGALIGFQT